MGSLKKPNNWSDLAGDEGGGDGGEAWGGGPWRAGKGGDGGGHQRAVWGATRLKNLTTGAGRRRGGGGPGRRWGHQKARDGGWGRKRRVRECGSGTRAEGSEVERVDKMWSGRWPGLEKGERRVWGHHDTRAVGAERQIKKESTNAGKW